MTARKASLPVLLVNTNRLTPVVAPLGLDYVGGGLRAAGVETEIADLALERHPEAALRRRLRSREYGLVGVTVRNTDDCYYASRQFFLPAIRKIIRLVRSHSAAPVVAGGVGYSVFSIDAWHYLGADFGISGDGEEALPILVRALAGGCFGEVPGLIWREGTKVRANPRARAGLRALPPFSREFVDNRRYLREGGMVGFETTRGCPMGCVYCADPVAKGRRLRLRPPRAVALELGSLRRQGVDTFHTCDSEFNLSPRHAEAVCREIIAAGLGEKIRWYAYCIPLGFTDELARLMKRAGCAGVNFGVDSADGRMLKLLGRKHRRVDIRSASAACREAGLITMFDLLLGGPGETAKSLAATVDFMKKISPHRVGMSFGLRVYPGTLLASRLSFEGNLLRPAFYLSPSLGSRPEELVLKLIGGDERFFTAGLGGEEQDYNYSGHDLLVRAIRKGHRGAFWDILRRLQDDIPPL